MSIESKAQAYRDRQLDEYLASQEPVESRVVFTVECRKTSKHPARKYDDSVEDEVGSGLDVANVMSNYLQRLWMSRHVSLQVSPVTGKRFSVYDVMKPSKPYFRHSSGLNFAMVRYGEFTAKLIEVSDVEPDEPDWESIAEDRAEARAARYDY